MRRTMTEARSRVPWKDRTEVAAAEEAVVSSVPSPHHPVPVATRRPDSAACAGGARWVTLVAQQGGGVVVVVAASEWHCGGRHGEGIKELYGGEHCGGQDRGAPAPGVNSAGDGRH